MDRRIKIFKWVFFSLMVAINVFIIFQSCLPATSSSQWSDVVVEVIENISGGSVTPSSKVTPSLTVSEFVRKAIGHFALFGIDGVISFFYFYFLDKERHFKYRWLYPILALAVGIFVASLTEAIQLIIPGRYGDIIDVLLDVGGFVALGGITYLIVLIINHHKNIKGTKLENEASI